MGLELDEGHEPATTTTPGGEDPGKAGRADQPPVAPSAAGVVVDCVALVGVFALMGLRILEPSEGLPWLAMLLAARLTPNKRGGVATLAAGLIAWDSVRR